MDQRELAHQDPEVIRHQIDETRSAITEKLEALEEQVTGTVQNARESVEETIQSAKETVQETVDTIRSSVHDTVRSVKQTFDVKHQVDQHPWPMMGVAFLAGVGGAVLVDRMVRKEEKEYRPSVRAAPLRSEPVREESPSRSALSGLRETFGEEIDKVKGAAVGYLMALARDWAKTNFPDLAPQIHDFMHGATEKLGGSPIDHPVLHQGEEFGYGRTEPFSRH